MRLQELDRMHVNTHAIRFQCGKKKKKKKMYACTLFCESAVRIEPIQNVWAHIALRRIAYDLNRKAVRFLSESHVVSCTAQV